MSKTLIIVGRSDIREGKLNEVKAALNEVVEAIKEKEPRIIFYNVYINEDGTQLTVVQAHPDSASVEFHAEVEAPYLAAIGKDLNLSRIDIYGTPSQSLLDKQQSIEFASRATVGMHGLSAGFTRF